MSRKILLSILLIPLFSLAEDAPKVLWQIGKPDHANTEFALAPKDYSPFENDGFFVVGSSDAKRDWPYVHPGPKDGWAGGGAHTFTILFGIKDQPAPGNCLLRLDLIDTHSKAPSRLRIEINGKPFEYTLPLGGGDSSVGGNLAQAKPHCAKIEFSSSLLKAGRNDIAIVNENGSWFLYDAVTMETPEAITLAPLPDAAALLAKANTQATPVEQIIVVCKTHFDIGYTHRVKDLLNYYRTTMIDRAIDVMDNSKDLPPEQQFVWTSPGWVMEKVLDDWPGQTPERRNRLEATMKSGKFVTHALPFSIEAELLEPEEFARGYVFADTISRKYGLPLAAGAKTTDVPSQSRSLATGLAHGGVKFMHIGCNWPSGYVHDLPPVFWWEGPDGSRVLTIYSSVYGTSTAFWPWGGKDDPGVGQNLIPPKNWPYKTWVAIIVTGDNSGPPNAKGVKAIFEEVTKKLPNVKVRMGTMEEFADALLAEKPDLPVVKGETPDTWIHGCMCDPGGVSASRITGPLMPAVEMLNTQLRNWGVPVADPAQGLSKAHEQYLLYNEHTWGGSASVRVYGEAFQKTATNAYKNLEGSWEDKTDYIRTASAITTSLLNSNLIALAQAVNQSGPRIVVFNPLPWARSAMVTVDGKPFLADNIPASGYKTFPLQPITATTKRGPPEAPTNGLLCTGGTRSVASAASLENEFYKVLVDPSRGTLTSLVDKRTGRDWVDGASAYGLGQYLNERFDKKQTDGYCRDYQQGRWGNTLHPGMSKPGLPGDVPYRAASGLNGTVRLTTDTISSTAFLEMHGDPTNHLPATSLRVTLYRNQPYIDLELTIKDKPKDNWPEADWLCLPFKLNAPRFSVGRNLGTMDPATDILKGANRDLYAVGNGVTLADDDGAGIAVCPLDHPLISLDTPGIWKFTLDFIPKKPIVFLNLYNNQWNTNYRYWYAGTWSSRVRLWTFDKKTPPESVLTTPALEARLPLVAVRADGPGGTLPNQQAGITLSRSGLLVTAFAARTTGQGTLLRVWEVAGLSGPCTITLPEGTRVTSAQPVNLRGQPTGRAIQVTKKSFVVDLKGFAPASFILVD